MAMNVSASDNRDEAMPEQAIQRPGKSQSAFRTISEVADDLDVAQHVLRFWESKFPQVRPLKRGGGRRYYRPEDVEVLRRIRVLLYDEGYTIKGAQRLLRSRRSADEGAAPRRAVQPAAPLPAADTAAPVAMPQAAQVAAAPAEPRPAALPQETVSTPVLAERRRLARLLHAELSELQSFLRAALEG